MCFIVTDVSGNTPDERREFLKRESIVQIEGGVDLDCPHGAWHDLAHVGRYVRLPRSGGGCIIGVVDMCDSGPVILPGSPEGHRTEGPILMVKVAEDDILDIKPGLTLHLLSKLEENGS